MPKIHPGANYTYVYNLHTMCKSAHVNGALEENLLHWPFLPRQLHSHKWRKIATPATYKFMSFNYSS